MFLQNSDDKYSHCVVLWFLHKVQQWRDYLTCAVNLQIWDFNLGRSRGPEDTSGMEAAYVTNGAASFTIKNLVDHGNRTCPTNTKGVKEICKVNSSR